MANSTLETKQWRWLQKCLERNKETTYGKLYGFKNITSTEEYQSTLPIITYENIEPMIEQIARGAEDMLFAGKAMAFEVTSGSSGGAKLIPYTSESFEDFQRAILPWLQQTIEQYAINPQNAYWAITPINKRAEKTEGGIAIGVSDSQYLGIKSAEGIVPEWVIHLSTIEQWRVATLYWLIRYEALELISIWSPSFLLLLLEGIDRDSEELLSLLSLGGSIAEHKVSSDAEAHQRLSDYLITHDTQILWSQLKLISLWQDGASAPYALILQRHFPSVAFQPKGLLSTECIVTTPDISGQALLSDESGFYEFIDSRDEVHLAHQLHRDEVYEVVVTTSGGLYRYRTGDSVLCEGYKETKPILKFLHRVGRVSDMVGEKLSEAFVMQALSTIAGFAMLVPHQEEKAYYSLVIERGVDQDVEALAIEERLYKNPQYRYARELGQLGVLEVVKLHNPMDRYISYLLSQGKRIGDIKIPRLGLDDGWVESS